MTSTGIPPEAGPSMAPVAYPDHLRQQVEAYLDAFTFVDGTPTQGLADAMRYSLLAGGKRIRPVLALATAHALRRDPAGVLPLAAAIELIHTYSLIHDDLPAMDDDDLRRGRPTLHKAHGEDVAILAGDALYAEAFRHVLMRQDGDPANVVRALTHLATATGVNGMVGGQWLDVAAADVDLRVLHALKTGALIGASIECVLLLDGQGLGPWRPFTAELGVLFQIVDDILDVTGTDDALGKPQGSDERHGKRTYVSEFGLAQARTMAERSHQTARDALASAAPSGAPELEQITDFIFTRTS